MKALLTPVFLLLLKSQVLIGRQRLPKVKVKESTVHTIKLPAQPYQLKNGSYVSSPLTGADPNINSLLSFLKRTNILKVPTNFTSNGRPMGVSTDLNIQELNPILSPAVVIASTEKPKSKVTASSIPTISTAPSVTTQILPKVTTTTAKVTTTTAKVTTAVKQASLPKLTTTSTTVTTAATTETTISTTSQASAKVPAQVLVPHRAVMWWPSLLPWHLQPSSPHFPLPFYPQHRIPYPYPPVPFLPRYASPPPPRPPLQQKYKPSQQPRVPASTTPLYLSTWLLPSHLLYKYTKH